VWHEASGAELVHLPINEGGEGDQTDFVHQLRAGTLRSFSPADLARYYASTVRLRARTFGRILEELAAPGRLPALVHCTAGKDRTGILVALLLETLGTPRETVVADYALTGILRPNRVAAYSDVLAASGIEPAAVSALFDTPPETMRSLLEGIDAEFGSVRAFLHGRAGLGSGAMDRLGEELLEPL
jgi:protein-tyrosine phosphatase